MAQPTRTTTCLIAHFEGYVDDVCDIQDDPQLEEDIKAWHKDHPKYDIHLIKYNHPGSSHYPMYADVYYTEHGGRWWHYQLEPTVFIGSELTDDHTPYKEVL